MTDLSRRAFPLALPVAALATKAFAQTASAPPALTPASLETLANTVTNMGYDVRRSSSGRSFSITTNGNFDVIVSFNASNDGTELLGFVYLQSYDPKEFPKLDLVSLLVSNDSEYSYFSLNKSDADYKLYLQRNIEAASATAANVRVVLTNLQKVTNATVALWDKTKWT